MAEDEIIPTEETETHEPEESAESAYHEREPEDETSEETTEEETEPEVKHAIAETSAPETLPEAAAAWLLREKFTLNSQILLGIGRALRRVVVDDAPAFREPLKNQREDPAHVSGLPLQVPFSQHHCRVRA